MKKSERKYYDKNKVTYLLVVGGSYMGCFDLEGNKLDETLEMKLDMYKVRFGEDIYLLRILNKKGIGLLFKITRNDIDLYNPKIYSIESNKGKMDWTLWIELDEAFKCLSESD